MGVRTFAQRQLRRALGMSDLPLGTGEKDHLYEIALADFLGALPNYVTVNERNAMRIATVASARHTIAGTLGRLTPFAKQAGARVPQAEGPALLRNACLEPGIPRSTTLTNTFGAMFFQPHTWWHVVKRDYYGWPEFIEWVPLADAGLDSDGRLVKVRNEEIDADRDVIRFDSPLGDGFLRNAADNIRRALAIDLAAAKAEDSPIPAVELHNETDKELTKTEREALLDAWADARRKRGVAYTPKGITVKPHGKPQDALLIDGRRAISIDLIRQAHLPAWAASTAVEGATMTYDNRALRNWELLDLGLSPYIAAFGDRLSMPDVTPRGWEISLDTDDFTRDDLKTRFEAYEIGKRAGFVDNSMIAAWEGWATVPADNSTTTEETA